MERNNNQRNSGEKESPLLSRAIKAGRRTYFMDVHSTRGGDDYVVITESRKHTSQQGEVIFDRQRIFLYKEDFEKFTDGLAGVIDFIRQRHPDYFNPATEEDIDAEFDRL